MIPAKADTDKLAEYLEQILEPRLNEARAGQRAVFFVDAAHFVLAPFLGFLWSAVRLFIRAPDGNALMSWARSTLSPTNSLLLLTTPTSHRKKSVNSYKN